MTGKATAVLTRPRHVRTELRGAALRLAFQQNVLLEGLVQVAVKLAYFDDRVVYLDLAITNEPTLDFPESVGFMGSIAGVQPPGPRRRRARTSCSC